MTRNGKPEITVVDEAPFTPLPEPVSWNLENAGLEYGRYHEALREERDLDTKIERATTDAATFEAELIQRIKDLKDEYEPRIAKARDDLRHLNAHKATLGRIQLKHIENTSRFHRMAYRECVEQGIEPLPPTFEEFTAAQDKVEARLSIEETAEHPAQRAESA